MNASPPPPAPLSARRLRLVMALVTGALFMEILDGSIITTAMPAMARSFGRPPIDLTAGVSAYLLALGIFIPVSGWIADRFGARRIFVAAIALFTATSALCALVGSLEVFLCLRMMQGTAGAMMVPVGRLIVMHFTPRDRLMAALTGLTWPALVAPVLGPPLGGLITEHLGWRGIFLLNVPLGVAALAAAAVLVPDAYGEARRRFDGRGFVLSGTGTFALLWGLDRLGLRADPISFALLGGGLAMLVLAVRHLWHSPAPMVDLAACRIATFRASVRGGTCWRMAVGAAPFLLPLLFQAGFGYDAVRSGLLLLVLFVGNVGMKTLTTPVLRRFGYRRVLLVNGAFCTASLVACALLTRGTPLALTAVVLLAGGITRSLQFTTLSTLAFADVPPRAMSDANGLFATISQVGQAAGIALATLSVRGAGLAARTAGWQTDDTGASYRLAFLVLALVSALGLIEARTLREGAGDAFVGRGRPE